MQSKFLWLLDNGHGKATPGKRSPVMDDGSRLFEYEFNRDIVKRMAILLDAAGISYHILVPETEGDIPLGERVRRANSLPSHQMKVYVSVHSNAADSSGQWSSARGIESYCYRMQCKSALMADIFRRHQAADTGMKDRGVKTANFYVLKYTRMPAILTENGFYTNKEECALLMTDAFRQKIAQAHCNAIQEIETAGLNI